MNLFRRKPDAQSLEPVAREYCRQLLEDGIVHIAGVERQPLEDFVQ